MKQETIFIIAEAGLNHNSSLDTAKNLVETACDIGANAIKFQTFKAESMVAKSRDKNQYDLLKSLELSYEHHKILFDLCRKKDMLFLSTPFDEASVDFLDDLGIAMFKVASGELTNIPLLEYIAKKNKPVILSTGMANLSEVGEAIDAIQKYNQTEIIVLHCVANYPAAPNDVNLLAMETMELAFHLPVGYSDHTMGIEIPIAAAAMGARVIEKHFTLDRNMPGPDHQSSLNPGEFKQMVQGIRNVELALGDGIKVPVKNELPVREAARKSVVTTCEIPSGTILTKDMLAIKRPGTGMAPKYINTLIGKKSPRHFSPDELIVWDDFLTS